MFSSKQTLIVPEIHGEQNANNTNFGQVPNLELESGTTGAPGHMVLQDGNKFDLQFGRMNIYSQSFVGPNHTFTVKAVNQPITDSQTGTAPDVSNSTSDQLAIYNGVTKLWGVSEAGYVLRPNQPSFLVYGSPSKNGNIVYNFQNTEHNIGSHYDNSNGKFTAPISGRYLFCASIWATANSNEYMYFNKNNTETVGVHQAGDSVASSGSVSTVLNLLAGDFVELICRYSIQGSTPRNNFSGQLLG